MSSSAIIVGVDPGSRCTGYGVINAGGGRLSWCDGGVLTTPRKADLGQRCLLLHDGLSALLDRVRPEAVAMEQCFMGRFAQAALTLGHARGALMVAVLSRRIPLFEYAPRQIKMAVTGTGAAGKGQIQAMAPRLVSGTPEELTSDEADALAAAICHAHRAQRPSAAGALSEVLP